jgi:hypothetical protein
MISLINAAAEFYNTWHRLSQAVEQAAKDHQQGIALDRVFYGLVTTNAMLRPEQALLQQFEEEKAHFKFNAVRNGIRQRKLELQRHPERAKPGEIAKIKKTSRHGQEEVVRTVEKEPDTITPDTPFDLGFDMARFNKGDKVRKELIEFVGMIHKTKEQVLDFMAQRLGGDAAWAQELFEACDGLAIKLDSEGKYGAIDFIKSLPIDI